MDVVRCYVSAGDDSVVYVDLVPFAPSAMGPAVTVCRASTGICTGHGEA